jgi:hypothetical protein
MKRTSTLLTTLGVLCAAASAQNWPTQVTGEAGHGRAYLQGSSFNISGDGAGARTGLLLGAEYFFQPTLSVGGWYAHDSNVGGSSFDWFNLRFTQYFAHAERSNYGFSLGYLHGRVRMEGETDNLGWVEGALTGTWAIDEPDAPQPRLFVSGTLGYAVGTRTRSGGGFTETSNAITYGAALTYEINPNVKVITSFHVMDFTDTGAGKISRWNLGVGFRF